MEIQGLVFPFGQKVHSVVQVDRSPKKVFVLGVYASAVHARWLDEQGQTLVQALAVASEPYIFWRGENAAEIVAGIQIPPDLGTLTPAGDRFNGPSGRALDELFLEPLGCSREEAWLCDMVPHACLNPKQRAAIGRTYEEKRRAGYNLPAVNLLPVPNRAPELVRRREIVAEIEAAQPRLLILLGDMPIQWFLSFYQARGHLADFGIGDDTYGRVHECRIEGKPYAVLPLVHPRQAGALGSFSTEWQERHLLWKERMAPEVGRRYLG